MEKSITEKEQVMRELETEFVAKYGAKLKKEREELVKKAADSAMKLAKGFVEEEYKRIDALREEALEKISTAHKKVEQKAGIMVKKKVMKEAEKLFKPVQNMVLEMLDVFDVYIQATTDGLADQLTIDTVAKLQAIAEKARSGPETPTKLEIVKP
ncbi:hypothetical protein ES702_07185 [subsurface metagenome]